MLREVAPRLHVHTGQIRFFGFRVERTMTIVGLADDRLFVHSPNPFDAALAAAVDELGRVAFVVAPNGMHTHAVAQVAGRYPDAVVCVSPAVPVRHPQLAFDLVLGPQPEAAWREELDQVLVEGNPHMREVVFLHRASGTLIVTDLIENVRRRHLSFGGRVMARLFGIYGRTSAAPEHSYFADDPAALRTSLDEILAWDFDRVLLAHGDHLEHGGKAAFEDVAARLVRSIECRGPIMRRLGRAFSRWS